MFQNSDTKMQRRHTVLQYQSVRVSLCVCVCMCVCLCLHWITYLKQVDDFISDRLYPQTSSEKRNIRKHLQTATQTTMQTKTNRQTDKQKADR